jgi:hypothetical protein
MASRGGAVEERMTSFGASNRVLAGQVVDDHTHRARTALGEAAGGRIRPVAEFGHRLEHGLAPALADVRRTLQDQRNQ